MGKEEIFKGKESKDIDIEEVLRITKEMGIEVKDVKEGKKVKHKIKNKDGEYEDLDLDKIFEGFKKRPMDSYYYEE